ncbi:hypothetical protein DTO271G3_724 [Paecilomyces variotii]|nr:hypothetical protein DTO271G3_724 [Paecilomyces variotii]
MGLKRKASFTASPSATPVSPGAITTSDETSRYLPSRTRKRFRDDRPDEQTIYAQTLRWLFSAAQKPTPSLASDEPTSPPPPSEPEPIDSRQQTLDKFFRRVKSAASPAVKSTAPQQTETPPSAHWNMMKPHANEGNALTSSDESGLSSPNSTVDIEMDM